MEILNPYKIIDPSICDRCGCIEFSSHDNHWYCDNCNFLAPFIVGVRQYAIKCHRETNHLYGNHPYEVHLKMVYDTAVRFINLIPYEDQQHVLAACWVHDVIEDCRQTYNDVKKQCNEIVANIAYALTNEKGKTRHERANNKYYIGIRNTPYATFVKICDRIANYEYSKKNGSRMNKLYEDEMPDFINQLSIEPHIETSTYDEMFEYLITLKIGI